MPEQKKFDWKKFSLVLFIFLLILSVLAGSLYFYFQIYLKRNPYPSVSSQIDELRYKDNNFQKVDYENGNYSYYVPTDWILSDTSLNTYSDILNGSNTYLHTYPNNLGILTPELCKQYSEKIKTEFTDSTIYSSAELKSHDVSTKSNFQGCRLIFEETVNDTTYEIRQFYIFRKDRIYQLFIQIPKNLQTQQDIADLIEASITIND